MTSCENVLCVNYFRIFCPYLVRAIHYFSKSLVFQPENVLLKKKRDSVCAVLAAVNLTDAETIKKQNIIKTLSQIRELAKDKEFLAFVKSCRETEKSE